MGYKNNHVFMNGHNKNKFEYNTTIWYDPSTWENNENHKKIMELIKF